MPEHASIKAAGGRAVPRIVHGFDKSVRVTLDPDFARWRAARRVCRAGVIAVGTTVVRVLETAVRADGALASASGWTSLVIAPERGLQAVDGLITGWHEPQASHLQMLEPLAGPELLARSYDSALGQGYRWHEFGDSHLIL